MVLIPDPVTFQLWYCETVQQIDDLSHPTIHFIPVEPFDI